MSLAKQRHHPTLPEPSETVPDDHCLDDDRLARQSARSRILALVLTAGAQFAARQRKPGTRLGRCQLQALFPGSRGWRCQPHRDGRAAAARGCAALRRHRQPHPRCRTACARGAGHRRAAGLPVAGRPGTGPVPASAADCRAGASRPVDARSHCRAGAVSVSRRCWRLACLRRRPSAARAPAVSRMVCGPRVRHPLDAGADHHLAALVRHLGGQRAGPATGARAPGLDAAQPDGR